MLPRLSQTLQLLTDLCGGVFADTEAATFVRRVLAAAHASVHYTAVEEKYMSTFFSTPFRTRCFFAPRLASDYFHPPPRYGCATHPGNP